MDKQSIAITLSIREGQPYTVTGVRLEGDWLGRDRLLALDEGDTLAFLSAGAYGMAIAGNYNSRPRAPEVMIVDGEPRIVREREAAGDLFALEHRLA